MAKQFASARKATSKRTRPRATQSRVSLARLEQRMGALERRLAILEARLPQPPLGEKIPDTILPKRGVTLTQDQ